MLERNRCILAWYLPQIAFLREEAEGTGKGLVTHVIEQLKEINIKSHEQPFDSHLCKDTPLADIDMVAVNSFFQKERTQQQEEFDPDMTDQELLEKFGLLQESVLTYAALLCFGKNPSKWIANAFTRCTVYRGIDKDAGLGEDKYYRGSLLEQFESSIEFLQRNLRLNRTIDSRGSIEQSEIPPVVLREAGLNLD